MREPLWIESEETLAIHDMMLAQHGGLAGVRDQGLLDSALSRPRNAFHHGQRSLFRLAGAYAGGIIQNHPFNDGNKRTGFLVAATFLEVNGLTLRAPESEVVAATVALAGRELSEVAYSKWLEANCDMGED